MVEREGNQEMWENKKEEKNKEGEEEEKRRGREDCCKGGKKPQWKGRREESIVDDGGDHVQGNEEKREEDFGRRWRDCDESKTDKVETVASHTKHRIRVFSSDAFNFSVFGIGMILLISLFFL